MDKGKIHSLVPFHVIGLVLNTIVGVQLLTLAHTASPMGYNEWWLPFLMGIVAQLTLLPMVAIGRRYPDDSLFVINEKLLGKWIGRIINILTIIYAILMVTGVNEEYVSLVQTAMMNSENNTLPLLALSGVMLYLVLGGIKLIARFCLITFFFTIWMVFYLQWGFETGGIMHIIPLFNTNLADVLNAFHHSYPSMLGYELILVYFPFIQRKEKALLHVSIGIWIVVLLYTAILLTSVAYFSEWEMANLVFPILNLFKAVELSFLERIENLGISIWVFLTLSTSATYLWSANKGWDEITGKQRLWHLYALIIVSSVMILSPLSSEWKRFVYDKVVVYMAYCLILWPLFLLLLDAIGQRNGGREA